MEFKLRTGKEKHTVNIEDEQNINDVFNVKCNKKEFDVKIGSLDNKKDITSLIIDNKMYDIEVVKTNNGVPEEIVIDGQNFPIVFEKINRQKFFLDKPKKEKNGTIRAAIPGQIVGLFVEVGNEVQEGDTLFILEAMKMENEIKSPKSGFVAKINIKVGDTVMGNDILMIID